MSDATLANPVQFDSFDAAGGGISIVDEAAHTKRAKWDALRAKAVTRARITICKAYHNRRKRFTVWEVRPRRFCFTDHSKIPTKFSIVETPHSLGFKTGRLVDGKWATTNHYILSFRRGKVRLYNRRINDGKPSITNARPFWVKILPQIDDQDHYRPVIDRYHARVIALVRRKARANGVRMPSPKLASGKPRPDIVHYLSEALYPGLRPVWDRWATYRVKADMRLQSHSIVWPKLRRSNPTTATVAQDVTGYWSPAIEKAFWDALRPPIKIALDKSRVNGELAQAPDHFDTSWTYRWSWCALLRRYLSPEDTVRLLQSPNVVYFDIQLKNVAAARRGLKGWTSAQLLRIATSICVGPQDIRKLISSTPPMLDLAGRRLKKRAHRGEPEEVMGLQDLGALMVNAV